MHRLQQTFIFIFVSLMINICLYGLFTVNGYTYIYDLSLKINTRLVETDNDDYREYIFFKKHLNKNMIFFIEYKINDESAVDFYIDFLKYLKKETGIKYLFDEVGFSAGQILNLYLQTGDENLLKQIFESAADTDIYTKYRELYYRKLYEYNNTLAQTERIILYGIDTESPDKIHTVIYLDYLIDKIRNKSVPSKINNIINGNRTDKDQYFNNIKKSLEQNESLYKELFVEDYFYFALMIDNYFTDKSDYNAKLQKMAVNFIKIYDKNPRGKYFGLFSDTGFIEKAQTIYNDVNNRIMIYEVQDTLFFKEQDKYGKIYSVNNNVLKHFIKYREFVYHINGRNLTENLLRESDTFFVFNNTKE